MRYPVSRFGLQLPVPQCRYDPQPRSGGFGFGRAPREGQIRAELQCQHRLQPQPHHGSGRAGHLFAVVGLEQQRHGLLRRAGRRHRRCPRLHDAGTLRGRGFRSGLLRRDGQMGRRSTARTAPAWSATCVGDRSSCSATPTATRFRAGSATCSPNFGGFSPGYAYGSTSPPTSPVPTATRSSTPTTWVHLLAEIHRQGRDPQPLGGDGPGQALDQYRLDDGRRDHRSEALAAANRTTTM